MTGIFRIYPIDVYLPQIEYLNRQFRQFISPYCFSMCRCAVLVCAITIWCIATSTR